MHSSVGLTSGVLSGILLMPFAAACRPADRDERIVDSLAVVEAVRLGRSTAPRVLLDPKPLIPDPDWTVLDSSEYAHRDDIVQMRLALLSGLGAEATENPGAAGCPGSALSTIPGPECPTIRELRLAVALSRVDVDTIAGSERPIRVVRLLINDVDSLSRSALIYDLVFARDSERVWSFQSSRLVGAID